MTARQAWGGSVNGLRTHTDLKKERTLKGKGIKVLSLFFIDRVANYRVYNDDGTTSLGRIGQWFEDAYRSEEGTNPEGKGDQGPFAVFYRPGSQLPRIQR